MSENCPDCNVAPGSLHEVGCDVERCPRCGYQMIGCDCTDYAGLKRMPWTGEWPGYADARGMGLWCKWTADGWRPCEPTDPAAKPDLNRLSEIARWDAATARWVRK